MKFVIRQSKMRKRHFYGTLLIFFAVNFLSKLLVTVQSDYTHGTQKTRSIYALFETPLYWVDEHHISVHVTLGHDNQPFNLLVDTLADTTWVAHSRVTSPAWRSRQKFSSHDSLTFKQGQKVCFHAHQGKQLMDGYTATDKLQIDELQITEFPFKLATSMPETLNFPAKLNGVLGLAHSVYSFGTIYTMLEALNRTHPDMTKIFGIKLCDESGIMTIGAISYQIAKYSLDPVPLKPKAKQWAVAIQNIYVGSHVPIKNPGDGYIVTSYGYIQGPAEMIKTLNKHMGFALNINGTFYFGGTKRTVFHPVKISISHHAFVLKKEQYVKTDEKGRMYSLFHQHDKDFWILGLAALRGYYVRHHNRLYFLHRCSWK